MAAWDLSRQDVRSGIDSEGVVPPAVSPVACEAAKLLPPPPVAGPPPLPISIAAPAPVARPRYMKEQRRPDRALPMAAGVRRGWKLRFFRSLGSKPAMIFLAVVIVPGLMLGQRHRIVGALPQTATLYSAIGLPVNLDGLALRNVTSTYDSDNGNRNLVVRGEIVNLRRKAGPLPNLHLALRDSGGRTTYTWQAPSPQRRIAAGSSIRFLARLDAPPDNARDVVVRFARAGD